MSPSFVQVKKVGDANFYREYCGEEGKKINGRRYNGKGVKVEWGKER